MKRDQRKLVLACLVGGALSTGIGAVFVSAKAQQPSASPPTQAYQTMLSDFRTMEGADTAATGAHEHFKASLQAALDQVVKDQQKAAADLAAADSRLAWVLDNWVKPAVKP